MNTFTEVVAKKFHSLAATAARNGGFWVSAGGGTANVVAGEISRATGVTFEDAHIALDVTGGPDWYADMAQAQPWPMGIPPEFIRWDARLIARAAIRSSL